MTATATPVVAPRTAILIGEKEVIFTPYVIRKVGEIRQIVLDGEVQEVIYNSRRNLTYLFVNGVGGRIAAELVDDCTYESCTKARKVAPAKEAKVAAEPKADVATLEAVFAPKTEAPKRRRPKTEAVAS